jgi:hypothetical protein
MVWHRLLAILFITLALGCLLFGILYFAGLKSDLAAQYGAPGKAFSVLITALTVPLFNLGRFMARRRPPSDP